MAHSAANILSTRLLIRTVLNYFPRLPPQIILSVSWDLGRMEEGEGKRAVWRWREEAPPHVPRLLRPSVVYDNFTVAVYRSPWQKDECTLEPSAAKHFSGRRHIRWFIRSGPRAAKLKDMNAGKVTCPNYESVSIRLCRSVLLWWKPSTINCFNYPLMRGSI